MASIKKIITLLLATFIIVGCSQSSSVQNETIKIIENHKLNKVADNFSNEKFDYFSQIELDYKNFNVQNIEINHYKDGVVIDNLFRFIRQANDDELPNIQYIYVGYNLYPQQEFETSKQSITANVYLYGPNEKNKYPDEYSIVVRNNDNLITYNKPTLKNMTKIEYNNKYYVNPIIISNDYDTTKSITQLIDNGIELIVLEIN